MAGSAYSSWRYVDPVTGDEGNAILDPQGADVGHEDPFPPNGGGDPDGLPNGGEPVKGSARLFPIEGGGAQCVIDGIRMDCAFLGNSSVACPDNDCGPRIDKKTGNLTQPFQAFSDGYSGFLPQGATYQGNGKIKNQKPSRKPKLKPPPRS